MEKVLMCYGGCILCMSKEGFVFLQKCYCIKRHTEGTLRITRLLCPKKII